MARKVIADLKGFSDIILQYADSSEVNFKLDNLKFQDLMSIATNRFNTEFVFKIVNIELIEEKGRNIIVQNS